MFDGACCAHSTRKEQHVRGEIKQRKPLSAYAAPNIVTSCCRAPSAILKAALHPYSLPASTPPPAFHQVLEDLVEEDDSNPHTWHLLGMAYYGGHMLDEAQVGAATQGLRACRLQCMC